jgi:hypothetical protein
MEPESSISCSEEPTTDPYPEPGLYSFLITGLHDNELKWGLKIT